MDSGLSTATCTSWSPRTYLAGTWISKYKHRVITPIGPNGKPIRGNAVIDGLGRTVDPELQEFRKPTRAPSARPSVDSVGSGAGIISGSRAGDAGGLAFAIERNYDGVAQVMGMEMEGIDIAVLFPTNFLSMIARDNMDPHLSLAPMPGL